MICARGYAAEAIADGIAPCSFAERSNAYGSLIRGLLSFGGDVLNDHVGTGLSVVDLAGMRARFEASLRAPDLEGFVQAVIVSSCDVPGLVTEVTRLAIRYADLVAACRAGLVAEMEGDPAAWDYVADALPPAPAGHPLWQRGGDA